MDIQQLLQLLTGADRQAPVGLKGLAAGGPPPGPRAPTGGMFLTPNDVNQSLGLPQPGAGPAPAPASAPGKPSNLPMFISPSQVGQSLNMKQPPGPPMSGGTSFGMDGATRRMAPSAALQPNTMTQHDNGARTRFVMDESMGPPTPRPAAPPPPYATSRPSDSIMGEGIMSGMTMAKMKPPMLTPESSQPAGPSPGAGGPYTVQQGDMAYNIAKQILGPNAGHSKLMAFVDALAQANPEAFYGDNKLRAGATLNTNLPPPGPRAAPMSGPPPSAGRARMLGANVAP